LFWFWENLFLWFENLCFGKQVGRARSLLFEFNKSVMSPLQGQIWQTKGIICFFWNLLINAKDAPRKVGSYWEWLYRLGNRSKPGRGNWEVH
jgi:hypothetical protein